MAAAKGFRSHGPPEQLRNIRRGYQRRFFFHCSPSRPPPTKVWLAEAEAGSDLPRNIVGGPLQPCSFLPLTGYTRDGFCQSCKEDLGQHTVCIRCTQKFLDFSKRAGNDLSTPFLEYGFPGLKEGDAWCLCAERWLQAFQYDSAPDVIVAATHSKALDIAGLSQLLKHASNEPMGDDEMQ